jgi:alkanesulfonate monooxygenase SsuD/methylene tetrahydromethanopterin reductase-like flavin-dependent oxidoreductase (luciferase family)
MRDVYLQRWALSTVQHYEFNNPGFAQIEGYEYYGALANNIAKHGMERFNGFLADLQVWGTPDEVTEKLVDYVRRCDAGGLVIDVTFGGMPYDEARANFDLFAEVVLPELHRHDAGGDIGVTYGARRQEAPTGV